MAFNVVQRVTGEILRDFTAKHVRQLLVVALAQLAEGARGGDDDEIGNLAIQHALVEHIGDSAGKTVFRGLAFVRIGGTALIACADPLLTLSISGSGIAVSAGLASIASMQEQIELLAVGHSHGCSLG